MYCDRLSVNSIAIYIGEKKAEKLVDDLAKSNEETEKEKLEVDAKGSVSTESVMTSADPAENQSYLQRKFQTFVTKALSTTCKELTADFNQKSYQMADDI